MKKLFNKKGESLIESLVSILIFTLSSIMLYTMLSTATRLNQTVKETTEAYHAQMLHAEQAEDPFSTDCVVTFRYVREGTETELFRYNGVWLYQLNSGALYSYAKGDTP